MQTRSDQLSAHSLAVFNEAQVGTIDGHHHHHQPSSSSSSSSSSQEHRTSERKQQRLTRIAERRVEAEVDRSHIRWVGSSAAKADCILILQS
ncbi:hypothetical protein PGT21_002107 [Puccinia graminis f. sp. tritici]|uniref:Uncharacterized protein n=1 Tax=Puccinia graminis f. sp. tritici TaxID=56615 RepID=A0A5B0QSA1_PUCGR|nr:hypothetical protein PGT21_002107 [Puccinia graminis f. sp. tritici]